MKLFMMNWVKINFQLITESPIKNNEEYVIRVTGTNHLFNGKIHML